MLKYLGIAAGLYLVYRLVSAPPPGSHAAIVAAQKSNAPTSPPLTLLQRCLNSGAFPSLSLMKECENLPEADYQKFYSSMSDSISHLN